MGALNEVGVWVSSHPELILLVAALLTLASVHYSGQIVMEVGTKAFVDEDSELYKEYDHLYVERFGVDPIAVVIEADDVASPAVLKAMDRLSARMKDTDHVLAVLSISEIVAQAEEQATGHRVIPDRQEEIDPLLAMVDQSQLKAIMPDRRHTILEVAIPLHLKDTLQDQLVKQTEEAVTRAEFPPDTAVSVTGNVPLEISVKTEMSGNMTQLLVVAIVLMAIALLIFFNQSRIPILPLPVVLLGIAWTFGAMGYLGIPLSFVSMAAFPILIGLGIDYAIQFRSRIDEERSLGKSPAEAAASMMAHTVPAVFIALVLTAAGFVSLMTSSVPMVKDFGKLCVLGVFMCFLSAVFVGTPLLSLLKSPAAGQEGLKGKSSMAMVGPVLAGTSELAVRYSRVVLAIAIIVAAAGIHLDTGISTVTDYKQYIPQDLPELINYRHLTAFYGGSDAIDVIVQGDDLTDPKTLKWMDNFAQYEVANRAEVLSATSIATYIKAANGGQIPDDKTSVQAILHNLPSTVKDQYLNGHDTSLMVLNLGNAQDNIGEEGIKRLQTEINNDIQWLDPPPGVSVVLTGKGILLSTVILALTTGRVEMTFLGLVLIYLLLLAIYKDPIKSILPVVPMMIVIGWMGMAMSLLGIRYTPMTATLGALILGVGSEYAVLIMERFYEELGKGGDMMEVLKLTFHRIGTAIASSGLTVVFGFSALIFSPFMITNNFGAVTVLSMLVALLMTFTVFPVLLIGLERRRPWLMASLGRLKNAK